MPQLEYPDLRLQIGLTSSRSRLIQRGDYGLDPYSGFHIGSYPLYPKSRGSTHARSLDPLHAPHVVAGYLTHVADEEKAVRGLELTRELVASPQLRELVKREVRPGPEISDRRAWLE